MLRRLRDALASMGSEALGGGMFHMNVVCLLKKAPTYKMIQFVVGNVSIVARRNACTLRCGLCAPKAAQYKSSAVSPSGQSVGKARLGLTKAVEKQEKLDGKVKKPRSKQRSVIATWTRGEL